MRTADNLDERFLRCALELQLLEEASLESVRGPGPTPLPRRLVDRGLISSEARRQVFERLKDELDASDPHRRVRTIDETMAQLAVREGLCEPQRISATRRLAKKESDDTVISRLLREGKLAIDQIERLKALRTQEYVCCSLCSKDVERSMVPLNGECPFCGYPIGDETPMLSSDALAAADESLTPIQLVDLEAPTELANDSVLARLKDDSLAGDDDGDAPTVMVDDTPLTFEPGPDVTPQPSPGPITTHPGALDSPTRPPSSAHTTRAPIPDDSLFGELDFEATDPLIGTVFNNKVELVGKLGSGGMGTVYLGKHRTLEIDVAVKVLPQQLAQREEFALRFEREAKSAARLQHPNIVRVIDLDRDGPTIYIMMELVQGRSAGEWLRADGPLSLPETLRVIGDAALGLSVAHAAGIIHRDIKPDNIMIGPEGEVKVADFGLARVHDAGELSQTGSVMGSPAYMAPEQVRGEAASAAADIYGLGVTWYALLAGDSPFKRDNPLATMMATVDMPLPDISQQRPECPPELVELLTSMCSKDPAQRPLSCRDVVAAIEDIELRYTERPLDAPGRRRSAAARSTAELDTAKPRPLAEAAGAASTSIHSMVASPAARGSLLPLGLLLLLIVAGLGGALAAGLIPGAERWLAGGGTSSSSPSSAGSQSSDGAVSVSSPSSSPSSAPRDDPLTRWRAELRREVAAALVADDADLVRARQLIERPAPGGADVDALRRELRQALAEAVDRRLRGLAANAPLVATSEQADALEALLRALPVAGEQVQRRDALVASVRERGAELAWPQLRQAVLGGLPAELRLAAEIAHQRRAELEAAGRLARDNPVGFELAALARVHASIERGLLAQLDQELTLPLIGGTTARVTPTRHQGKLRLLRAGAPVAVSSLALAPRWILPKLQGKEPFLLRGLVQWRLARDAGAARNELETARDLAADGAAREAIDRYLRAIASGRSKPDDPTQRLPWWADRRRASPLPETIDLAAAARTGAIAQRPPTLFDSRLRGELRYVRLLGDELELSGAALFWRLPATTARAASVTLRIAGEGPLAVRLGGVSWLIEGATGGRRGSRLARGPRDPGLDSTRKEGWLAAPAGRRLTLELEINRDDERVSCRARVDGTWRNLHQAPRAMLLRGAEEVDRAWQLTGTRGDVFGLSAAGNVRVTLSKLRLTGELGALPDDAPEHRLLMKQAAQRAREAPARSRPLLEPRALTLPSDWQLRPPTPHRWRLADGWLVGEGQQRLVASPLTDRQVQLLARYRGRAHRSGGGPELVIGRPASERVYHYPLPVHPRVTLALRAWIGGREPLVVCGGVAVSPLPAAGERPQAADVALHAGGGQLSLESASWAPLR